MIQIKRPKRIIRILIAQNLDFITVHQKPKPLCRCHRQPSPGWKTSILSSGSQLNVAIAACQNTLDWWPTSRMWHQQRWKAAIGANHLYRHHERLLKNVADWLLHVKLWRKKPSPTDKTCRKDNLILWKLWLFAVTTMPGLSQLA